MEIVVIIVVVTITKVHDNDAGSNQRKELNGGDDDDSKSDWRNVLGQPVVSGLSTSQVDGIIITFWTKPSSWKWVTVR
jgi:hypothetical protein